MPIAYLALGSNLGDREHNLDQAVSGIAHFPSTELLACSSFHETAAVGPKQGHFINAAVAIKTALSPLHLLHCCQILEKQLGRTNTQRWCARIIDVDIISYENCRLDFEMLTLPHPRAQTRDFVQIPLAEIQQKIR